MRRRHSRHAKWRRRHHSWKPRHSYVAAKEMLEFARIYMYEGVNTWKRKGRRKHHSIRHHHGYHWHSGRRSRKRHERRSHSSRLRSGSRRCRRRRSCLRGRGTHSSLSSLKCLKLSTNSIWIRNNLLFFLGLAAMLPFLEIVGVRVRFH